MRRFPGHSNPPPPPSPPVITKTIKAKALRKKGTDLFYWEGFDTTDGYYFNEYHLPCPIAQDDIDWFMRGDTPGNLPKDAELIDITIIIEP